MLCETCKVNIDGRFQHAIKQNQCPACGGGIMDPVKLTSYLSLKELLGRHYPNLDVEGVSTLIVANFEIKQSFREELPVTPKGGIMESGPAEMVTEDVVEESDEPVGPVVHEGVMYEKVDKRKAQEMLQKMRDAALNDALNDRDEHDLADEAEMLMSGDESLRQEYLLKSKREASIQKVKAGGGAFTRS